MLSLARKDLHLDSEVFEVEMFRAFTIQWHFDSGHDYEPILDASRFYTAFETRDFS